MTEIATIDEQARTLEVEADSADAAKEKAYEVYNADDGFWDDVRQEPYDTGSPSFDILEPT